MAQICKSCHYNEMDFELACAAEYNYRKISENNNNVNVGNINVTNFEASPDSQDFLNWLKNLSPDLIYLDPARRDSRGNKVFLRTVFGSTRVLDMLVGEQLPRIC